MKRITLFFLTGISLLFGIFGISQAEEPHRSLETRCYDAECSPIPCKIAGELSCQGDVCIAKNLSDFSPKRNPSTPGGRKKEILSPQRTVFAGKGKSSPDDSQPHEPAPAPVKPVTLSEPTPTVARPAQSILSTQPIRPTITPIHPQGPVSPTFTLSDPQNIEKPPKRQRVLIVQRPYPRSTEGKVVRLPIIEGADGHITVLTPERQSQVVSPASTPEPTAFHLNKNPESFAGSLRKALEQYNATRAASSEDDPNNPVLENDLQGFLDGVGRAYHNAIFDNQSGTALDGDERINRSREESARDQFLRKDIADFEQHLIDQYGLRLNEGQKDYLFQEGKTRINNYDPTAIPTIASTPSQTSSETDDSSVGDSDFNDDWDDVEDVSDRDHYINSFKTNLRPYYQETAIRRGFGESPQIKQGFLQACLNFMNQHFVTERHSDMLNAEEKERFFQDGYRILNDVFPPAEPLLPSSAEEQTTDDQSETAEWRALEQTILAGINPSPPSSNEPDNNPSKSAPPVSPKPQMDPAKKEWFKKERKAARQNAEARIFSRMGQQAHTETINKLINDSRQLKAKGTERLQEALDQVKTAYAKEKRAYTAYRNSPNTRMKTLFLRETEEPTEALLLARNQWAQQKRRQAVAPSDSESSDSEEEDTFDDEMTPLSPTPNEEPAYLQETDVSPYASSDEDEGNESDTDDDDIDLNPPLSPPESQSALLAQPEDLALTEVSTPESPGDEDFSFDTPSGDTTDASGIVISSPETGGLFDATANTPSYEVVQEQSETREETPADPQSEKTTVGDEQETAEVIGAIENEEPAGILVPMPAEGDLNRNFGAEEDTLSLPETPESVDLSDLPEAQFDPPPSLEGDPLMGADPTGYTVGAAGESAGPTATDMSSVTMDPAPASMEATAAPGSFDGATAEASVGTETSACAASDVVPADVASEIAAAAPAAPETPEAA